MIAAEDIHVGLLIEHMPTQAQYIVNGLGKLRLPSGGWIDAARYAPRFPGLQAHAAGTAEYYRPLDDFHNFKRV